MKGLILNCLDRKTEAYELVRRGIKVSGKIADAKFRKSMHGCGPGEISGWGTA